MSVRDLIAAVRLEMAGGLAEEINLLDDPYTPGQGHIKLRYAKTIQPGTAVSVGLGTFYVWEQSADKRTLQVQAQYDGGPDVALPASEVVRTKPFRTTWAIFSDWNSQLLRLSSPQVGLYTYGTFGLPPDYTNGTYALPTTGTWATMTPIRLVKTEYRPYGYTYFVETRHAQWQPDNHTVRIVGPQPQGDIIQFTFAFPFLPAANLDVDETTLGLTPNTSDIPGLGCLSTYFRGIEARRAQPFAQGDPRRASEVQPGNNLGMDRAWAQEWQQRVNEEVARQSALYPWSVPL